MVSKEIRDQQLQLERSIPLLEKLRTRAMDIDQQRIALLDEKLDNPSVDDVREIIFLREIVRNLVFFLVFGDFLWIL